MSPTRQCSLQEPELLDIEDLQNLLEKLQLTAEGSPEPVLQACVRSWLSDKRDGVAHIVTIIELVSTWQYSCLCLLPAVACILVLIILPRG